MKLSGGSNAANSVAFLSLTLNFVLVVILVLWAFWGGENRYSAGNAVSASPSKEEFAHVRASLARLVQMIQELSIPLEARSSSGTPAWQAGDAQRSKSTPDNQVPPLKKNSRPFPLKGDSAREDNKRIILPDGRLSLQTGR